MECGAIYNRGVMEIFYHIFGNASGWEYLAFGFFAVFGMAWIKVARFNIKKKSGLRSNPVKIVRFNWSIWFNDNLLDFILALMTAFGFFRFFPDAFSFINKFQDVPEFTDKMFYGLLLGLFFQYLFHKWMNQVTITKIAK